MRALRPTLVEPDEMWLRPIRKLMAKSSGPVLMQSGWGKKKKERNGRGRLLIAVSEEPVLCTRGARSRVTSRGAPAAHPNTHVR